MAGETSRDRTPSHSSSWTWRVPGERENAEPGLLYEPGNWGDVLKSTWAVILTRELARRLDSPTFRYGDPFAGAATYPLTTSAEKRMDWLGSGTFVESQARWRESGALASTARLVAEEAAQAGKEPEIRVFDADPRRLESWRTVAGARILSARDSREAIGEAANGAHLLLVDPYDLFDRWPEVLPSVGCALERTWTLLYLYNRAPRGGGHLRGYRALRSGLEKLGRDTFIGRIPSDVILPRAFHEVVLLGPEPPSRTLERELQRATRSIACKMSTAGATEKVQGESRGSGSEQT